MAFLDNLYQQHIKDDPVSIVLMVCVFSVVCLSINKFFNMLS